MCGQLTNQNSLDPIKYSKLNLEVVKYAIKKIRKTRLWLFSIILNKVREINEAYHIQNAKYLISKTTEQKEAPSMVEKSKRQTRNS